jgi:hypothetical protein
LFAFVAHEVLLSQDEVSELNSRSSFAGPPQAPILIVFLLFQKWFVQGVAATGRSIPGMGVKNSVKNSLDVALQLCSRSMAIYD